MPVLYPPKPRPGRLPCPHTMLPCPAMNRRALTGSVPPARGSLIRGPLASGPLPPERF